MAYALGILVLLGLGLGVALVQGQRRRARERRALRSVMRQVIDGDPEAPRDKD